MIVNIKRPLLPTSLLSPVTQNAIGETSEELKIPRLILLRQNTEKSEHRFGKSLFKPRFQFGRPSVKSKDGGLGNGEIR